VGRAHQVVQRRFVDTVMASQSRSRGGRKRFQIVRVNANDREAEIAYPCIRTPGKDPHRHDQGIESLAVLVTSDEQQFDRLVLGDIVGIGCGRSSRHDLRWQAEADDRVMPGWSWSFDAVQCCDLLAVKLRVGDQRLAEARCDPLREHARTPIEPVAETRYRLGRGRCRGRVSRHQRRRTGERDRQPWRIPVGRLDHVEGLASVLARDCPPERERRDEVPDTRNLAEARGERSLAQTATDDRNPAVVTVFAPVHSEDTDVVTRLCQ
jgi:hypothetical protein